MVAKIKTEARPKRTRSKAAAGPAPESSAKPGAAGPLPTAEALALIAANVAKGIDLEPGVAVDYAFKLWKSAREKLAGETPAVEIKEPVPVAEEPAPVPKVTEPVRKSDEAGSLPVFPAAFDTFLRQVVNGKTLADATNRFRDYLRNTSTTEAEADKRLAKLAEEGFKDAGAWQVTALEYRDWWESRQSQPASQPADSPAPTPPAPPTPKTALPTFDTFLRTVVKGETDADSENKFRAFLRSKFPEAEADEQLTRLSQEGFKNISSWLETSREYRDWSKSEKPN